MTILCTFDLKEQIMRRYVNKKLTHLCHVPDKLMPDIGAAHIEFFRASPPIEFKLS